MQSCLGIYIEENLIKYAKVTREKDNIKIESFGTKFYEDIENAIDKIVEETNSIKSPIAINLSGERYDYYEVFALLNKQALKKSMDIEFEMSCTERGIKKNSMEKRYMFVQKTDDIEKMKAINVSISKASLEMQKDLFYKYNLTAVEPLPTSIINLLKSNTDKNELIVNMEEKTYLTFLKNGQIDNVQTLDTNIFEALNEITRRENSANKAYEILKNTTITTQEISSVMEDGNEYIDIIIPLLFKMLNEIKEKIAEFGEQIDNIYFSGTGVVINNVDMYFQDRLNEIQCEILKPGFLDAQSLKIGIKDYIEVNSAISMALNGLGIGTTNELNFGNRGNLADIANYTANQMSSSKTWKDMFKGKLQPSEKLIVRLIALCFIFVICYSFIAGRIMDGMNRKYANAELKIKETQDSIEYLEGTDEEQGRIELVEYLTKEYKKSTARLNNEVLEDEDAIFREKELTNFLTKLSTTMPTEIRLVSLENTEDRHIVIQARSLKYQQLGFFKTILEANNLLKDVKASTGVRYHDEVENQDYILVTIEGDLI